MHHVSFFPNSSILTSSASEYMVFLLLLPQDQPLCFSVSHFHLSSLYLSQIQLLPLLSLSLSLSLVEEMAVNTFPRMSQLEEEQIELPPGFRFHPTDEELITHYLTQKVVNSSFHAIAIGEADLNKSEPWDLPGRAKMGEKEWYFFCIKDRKYPTGLRTNRATESGYWKATGKDKEILRGKRLVGMKKTLVFYRGRAPKGEKSNWVMHEYRLEGKYPVSDHLLKTTKTEWVICRIFNKSSGDKRTHISELVALDQKPLENDRNSPALPPLMDYSHPPYPGDAHAARVTCFSNPIPMAMAWDETKPYADMVYSFKPPHHFSSSSSSTSANPSSFLPLTPFAFPNAPPAHPADSVWMPGNNIVRLLLENPTPSSSLRQVVNPKVEFPQYTEGFSQVGGNNCLGDEDHQNSSASDDPIDLESLWNY